MGKFTTLRANLLRAVRTLSHREWFGFMTLVFIALLSMLVLAGAAYRLHTVETPSSGGTLHEGFIGSPNIINPVLSNTDIDQSVSTLVFSGLMRLDPETRTYTPDLAEGYTLSEDEKTYTFILKDNLVFHDNTPISTQDIALTIELVQNRSVESPLFTRWQGVQVDVINEKTISFTLENKYGEFLQNTTLGILPHHIWSQIPTDQIEKASTLEFPIGSGPFKVHNIERDSTGIITRIDMKRFKSFALGTPYLKKVELLFFPNESKLIKALNKNNIDRAIALSPQSLEELSKDIKISTHPLSRIFSLFINTSENEALKEKEVRELLEKMIDKEDLISTSLNGFGIPANSPLPSYTPTEEKFLVSVEDFIENSKKISLNEEGTVLYDSKPISFTISTADTNELVSGAEYIKEKLSPYGINVTLAVFETGTLTQEIIRTRRYEVLLFGQIIQQYSDLFAFWHSSQRNDPGLNIALLTDSDLDTTLEKFVETSNEEERKKLLEKIHTSITEDTRTIFLYQPELIMGEQKNLTSHNSKYTFINNSSERLINIYKEFKRTHRKWKQ